MKPFRSLLLRSALLGGAALASAQELPALGPQAIDPVLRSGSWVLLEFGGQNCVPCRRMQPVLTEVARRLGPGGKVHNVWVTDHPQVARRFRVMVMPTQVLFDPKGKEVLRHQGFWEQEALLRALKDRGAL